MDSAGFTEDDLAYFHHQMEQARLAQPVIERDYAKLAGKDGSWVAFLDGELVARADRAEGLSGQLDEKGLGRERVLIRYLPGKDKVFVL